MNSKFIRRLAILGVVLSIYIAAALVFPVSASTPKKAAAPDLSGIKLFLSDLPSGFNTMPPERLDSLKSILSGFSSGLSEASFQNLAGFQTADPLNPQFIVSGLFAPLTIPEQNAVDGQLSSPSTPSELSRAIGGGDVTLLKGAGSVGNSRLAFSLVTSSLKMEYVVARRGPVLLEVAVLYRQDSAPLKTAVELAGLMDERAVKVVGTGEVSHFRAPGPLVPGLTVYIPTPLDVSTNPKVIGANLLLATVLMLPFAVAAEFITRILAEKEEILRRRFKPVDWLARLQERLDKLFTAHRSPAAFLDVLKLVGVMLFYGLVFSLLDKTWKPFSASGIVLFVSMTVAYGLVGVADDIFQWRLVRKWGYEADLAVRPSNTFLALISTACSRLFSLVPGMMFGTPDALSFDEERLSPDQHLRLHKLSARTFILIAVFVWLPTIITAVLQRLSLPEAALAWVGGVEAFLLVLFAVALENLFVQMLGFPGGFGQVLRKKNRWTWLVGMVLVTFIFMHTLPNPRGDLVTALREGNVRVFLAAAVFFILVAFILWLVTRRAARLGSAKAEVQQAVSSPVEPVPLAITQPPLPAEVTTPPLAPQVTQEIATPLLASPGSSRQCPVCGNTIKAEARLCRFCRVEFAVAMKGYCLTDHDVVDVDEAGKCKLCGSPVEDIHVESRLTSQPPPLPVPLHSVVPPVVPQEPFTVRPKKKPNYFLGVAVAGILLAVVGAVLWVFRANLFPASPAAPVPTSYNAPPTSRPQPTTDYAATQHAQDIASTAEAASALQESYAIISPILDEARQHKPNFEDDFESSDASYSKWSYATGEMKFDRGVMQFNSTDWSGSGGPLNAENFVLEFEVQPTLIGNGSSACVNFRSDSGGYNFCLNMFDPWWGMGKFSPEGEYSEIFGGYDNKIGLSHPTLVTIMAQNDRFAYFIGGEYKGSIVDSDNHGSFVEIGLYTSDEPAEIYIDNVRFWDLDNLLP